MRYDLVPHESFGPVRLGVGRQGVIELLGLPIQEDLEPWHWYDHPWAVEFIDDQVAFVGASSREHKFILDGHDLTGSFRRVVARLKSAGYHLGADPREPGSNRTWLLIGLDVLLWSNLGKTVDEVSVVSPAFWGAALRP